MEDGNRSGFRKKRNGRSIYRQYRNILRAPGMKKEEIDIMRRHISLLAQTVCEHAWGKKFY